MQIVVGLGNPGSEYEDTRHNLGFAVVDAVAEKLDIDFAAGRGDYLIGRRSVGGETLALVKPLTYMNNSGIAVREVIERYDIDLQKLLVVVDDIDLPLGKLRLRLKGSSGGHNGLYSVIYHLRSEEFPRLRCGIGSDSMPTTKAGIVDYVLSPFGEEEKPIVDTLIQHAAEAVLATAREGIERAMNRYNTTQV